MHLIRLFILGFLITWIVLGCQSTASHLKATIDNPDATCDVLDPSFPNDAVTDWASEAIGRFGSGVVVVCCHGGYTVDGTWLVYPRSLNGDTDSDRPWSVQHLILYEEAAHPNHIIVLLCCNVDSHTIHGFPWVYYSPSENFMVPTKFAPTAEQVRRAYADQTVVGDIKFFIQAK